MARVLALLRATGRASWRELGALRAFGSNNLLVFSLLIFGTQPASGVFLVTVLGLLALVPLGTGFHRTLPRSRFAVLPLTRLEQIALRGLTPLLNPALWIFGGLLAWRRTPSWRWVPWALALGLALGGLRTLLSGALGRLPSRRGARWPRLGWPGLVRRHLLELGQLLDVQAALLLSVLGCLHRLRSQGPTGDARLGLTLLVVLALSTAAQHPFILEGEAARERHALLPLPGWRVLLARDGAFLALLGLLVLPLAPGVGMTAGLGVLAAGHQLPAPRLRAQGRWTFLQGAHLPTSLAQVAAIVGAAALWEALGAAALGLAAAVWGLALGLAGRRLDRG